MNGALLGFSNRQMDEMYDEIVEFAELERFMDQRLKNYSSGIWVRLAFSITIRADTDILVLDEVLAVGDEAFHANAAVASWIRKGAKFPNPLVLVTRYGCSEKILWSATLLIKDGEVVLEGSLGCSKWVYTY